MTEVHAVPLEDTADHHGDRRCWCGPIGMRDLNEPARLIWRHRTPPDERHVRHPSVAALRWSGAPRERKP